MFKRLMTCVSLIMVSVSSLSFADCIQSIEFGLGWRRDDLRWRIHCLEGSYVDAIASSNIHYKDVNYYTAHAKARWADTAYYIRLSADYGTTYKGWAEEHFKIDSSLIGGCLGTEVNSRIKRRSEAYDFSGAVGYPFLFLDDCLMFVPVVGLSFHRQRLRVKEKEDSCSFYSEFSLSSSNPFFPTSTPILSSSSSEFDPFSDSSPSTIASLIGFSPRKRTSNYRFSWYGPYVGVDMAYALDYCWTIFTELEFHFLDRCHRKRESYTAIDFIDDFHHRTWAMGFNGSFGTTFSMNNCWFSTLAVDYKYWRTNEGHKPDSVRWFSAGINMTLGYIF